MIIEYLQSENVRNLLPLVYQTEYSYTQDILKKESKNTSLKILRIKKEPVMLMNKNK